jgi:hypothetical protein
MRQKDEETKIEKSRDRTKRQRDIKIKRKEIKWVSQKNK